MMKFEDHSTIFKKICKKDTSLTKPGTDSLQKCLVRRCWDNLNVSQIVDYSACADKFTLPFFNTCEWQHEIKI
jgi:hypothetical protein